MQDTFSALGVSAPVVEALASHSINEPFNIQTLALPDAIAGLDILGKAPTGSGKTLAFSIPIVERTDPNDRRPSALVLVPTRELALQVTETLVMLGKPKRLQVATVYGGAPIPAQAKKAKDAHVIVATPGRLQDLVQRRMLSLDHVRILVLDEADRMLDMGFKPQVEKLMRSMPRERQTMLFSATLDGEVNDLAINYTDSPSRIEANLPVEQEGGPVDHTFIAVTPEDKLDRLVEELNRERGLALVFVRTKRGADRLASKLVRNDVNAVALHGDMTQSAREKALKRFRSGQATTLVATDVAARGLDLDDITHVINFDPPEDDKGYVHRVGRTGRAGRSGSGITFVLPDQQADVSRFAAKLGHREEFEADGMSSAAPRRVYSSRRGRGSRW